MTVTLHRFLPSAGDSRDIAASTPESHRRAPTLDYLSQVAVAADRLGFTGVPTPTGTWCEDAWILASALLAETRRLHFLVAVRPGLISPTLAAQMSSTFQRAPSSAGARRPSSRVAASSRSD